MPEGPEIRLAADKLSKVLEGRVVQRVDINLDRIKHYESVLTGHRVQSVETRGKALLTHFSNDYSIYSHNQLYGIWRVFSGHKLPKVTRQLRLGLYTETHSAILYSASDISVWPSSELISHPFLSKIGPDILSPTLNKALIAERLTSNRFCNRTLHSLYLDQSFIAGLGNYLRSEILFDANLHPDTKPKDLPAEEISRLAGSTISVSKRSYLTQGYTLPTDLYRTAVNSKATFESKRFMVFDRQELPCRICSTPIIRQERNSRRIYWCPTCQPIV